MKNDACVLLAAPSITVKVDPPSALLAVGTPIVFRCSVNATVTPSISWSNGTDQLTEKEGSGGDDRERTIEITYHSTGVKKIVCSVKDDSSEHVIKATAKITVVGKYISTLCLCNLMGSGGLFCYTTLLLIEFTFLSSAYFVVV